jgi:hypothetical protein
LIRQLKQSHHPRSEQQAFVFRAARGAPLEMSVESLTVRVVELSVNVRREHFPNAPA